MCNKKTISWSRGLVKSREKNGRDSRSRETDDGEKIAATNRYVIDTTRLQKSKNQFDYEAFKKYEDFTMEYIHY